MTSTSKLKPLPTKLEEQLKNSQSKYSQPPDRENGFSNYRHNYMLHFPNLLIACLRLIAVQALNVTNAENECFRAARNVHIIPSMNKTSRMLNRECKGTQEFSERPHSSFEGF